MSNEMISRRRALQAMGGGFGWMALQRELQAASPLAPRAPHFPAKAKRVVFLFLNGGLSHVDSFDPKPTLARFNGKPSPIGNPKTERKTGNLMGSPFAFTRRGKSGLDVSELFPRLGAHADELCVIRSMHTDLPNHPPALLMMNNGRILQGTPAWGSWVTYGLGTENQNLPGYIVLGPGKPNSVGSLLWTSAFLPGVYQGTHIINDERTTDPEKLIPYLRNRKLDDGAQRQQLELLRKLNQEHQSERPGDAELESSIQSMEIAYRMQSEAMDAFDIRKESEGTRERYGSHHFGSGCLIARRLLERGVRCVQVYYGLAEAWDHHADIMMHQRLAPNADRAVAALLEDLRASGLLDETLVLIGSEFGRTPTAEISVRQFLQNGRDHNPYGFTMLLAGAGVKKGITYGSTDEFGWHAVENKVHVHDLHATMLHLLGLDHKRLTYTYSGREFRLTDVEGNLVPAILA